MIARHIRFGEGLMGRLSHGADLHQELTKLCIDNEIRLGQVVALGAVQKARIGYYDQQTREYHFFELDKSLEILNLTGNVSLKDGKPIVHAHITLGDKQGNAYGGHLAEGTLVFACEYCIQRLEGDPLQRGFDEETGLPLWMA